MSAYHTIKKLGHNIVLKEIQHLTGMTHCASSSGMEQFGSGSRETVNCFTLPAILCAVRHSSQMLYFFQNNVVPQFFNGMVCWHYHLQWICGYVHVYKIIKQLFHACSGNSQNYWPEVLEMTWELLPEAEQAWNNCILFLVPSDFQIFVIFSGTISPLAEHCLLSGWYSQGLLVH
jgi:hypothetical protein